MKKVYTTDSLVTVQHLKNLLELEGVACLVKNDQLYTLRAEVPFAEVWPQLWVINDGDLDRARAVVAEHLAGPAADLPGWTCGSCGEAMEGQFTDCWNCGASRPEAD